MLHSLFQQARLAVRLLREPRVPLLLKAIPVVAVLYLISPLDLIPDVLPVLGQLDDLGVMIAALELFVRLSPTGPASFPREALLRRRSYSPMSVRDDVIDAEFRHG